MDGHYRDLAQPLIDDILVHGATIEEHDRNLKKVLDRTRDIGLKLNPNKMVIGATSIKFAGVIISGEGVHPDPDKVKAIREMVEPKNREELKSFLGMCSYLGKFIPRLADKAEPLNTLNREKSQFKWKKSHAEAFQRIKQSISEDSTLRRYDVKKPVVLQVDASSVGLGACLLQEGKPVAYASATLNDTQKRYAQIEKETLAIKFGCKRFHQYIYGKEVVVETDNKPLEVIFRKNIEKAPPHIARMMMDLMKYKLKVKWIRGKDCVIADALSRISLDEVENDLDDKSVDIEVFPVIQELNMTEDQLEKFKTATETNEMEKELLEVIKTGWPSYYKDLNENLKLFWNDRDEFSHQDNIILKGSRVYIPEAMREKMLEELHSGHFGVEKTLRRARQTVYWPKMDKDIRKKIGNCEICLEHANMNEKEPMIPHKLPSRAWEKIGIDFLDIRNEKYLVAADYYSSFVEIFKMYSTTALAVKGKLMDLFSRYGIPNIIFSDNGSPFNSAEYLKFAQEYKFEVKTSSPKYPQSNGKAESGVKIAKNMLLKCKDWKKALMEYVATPLPQIGYSPSELMFGRRIRTTLPCTNEGLKKSTKGDEKERLEKNKEKQKSFYDRNVRRELNPLKVGDEVWMKIGDKKKRRKVTITKKLKYRSYVGVDENGTEYRRNRKFFTTKK